ncbi:MAG TPA: transposase [Candidatus Saccharimonadia bacterium]|nr:transposase [Candidatus Saccharimonadia bacterium]
MGCFWDAAIAAILEVTRYLGEASVRVVADAFYSKAPFLNELVARGIDVLSRLRKDAAGWDDPESPPPGKRGRKSRYGRKRRVRKRGHLAPPGIMVVQVGWEPGRRGLPHMCLCVAGGLPSTALPEAVAPGHP